MIRIILRRCHKPADYGATDTTESVSFETVDIEHAELERVLRRGGFGNGGWDHANIVGAEVRDEPGGEVASKHAASPLGKERPGAPQERIAELERLVEHYRSACEKMEREVCDCLAVAIGGFPRYCDDQENFPGATEESGYCVGEMRSIDMATLAASKISTLRAVVDEITDSCANPTFEDARVGYVEIQIDRDLWLQLSGTSSGTEEGGHENQVL